MKGVTKIILIIGAVVGGLIIVISILSMLFAKSFQVKLGETATIKEENVEITVLSSEKITIDDPTGSAFESGDFLKVRVRIKNNGSSTYGWHNAMFKIGNKYVALSAFGDDLPFKIDAGKTEEGYLYFEYTDESIMNYYTSLSVNDENTVSTKKYFFEIK